ncbi:MAG: hypothetical protein K2P33_09050 [Acutalibacter sp.]|nr:hypothetical protein [Acutalibacter sp.]
MAYTREDYILFGAAIISFMAVLAIIGIIVEWKESCKTAEAIITGILRLIVSIPIMTVYHFSMWRERRRKKHELIPWQPCRPRKVEYVDRTEEFQEYRERSKSA